MSDENLESAKYKLMCDFTSRSWGLGLEVGFPAKSKRFFMGTKLQTHFSITLYLGPLTVGWSKEPTVIEYQTDNLRELIEAARSGK